MRVISLSDRTVTELPMSADKIARMANQIATFMATKPHEEGVQGLAAHINDFWEPRMRRQLFDRMTSAPDDFLPMVHEAAAQIRRPQEA